MLFERSIFKVFNLILLTSSYLFISCGPETPEEGKPNIIFILVDDMGWGDVGVFWQNQREKINDRSEPWQKTPSLDALATSGAMLTHHYCPAPVCAPSRASLLLGVSQGHANVRDNQFDKILQETYTMGNVLQEAGYHTAAIGKWGLQGRGDHIEEPDWPGHPLNRGFDYYLGYIRHRDGHEHYPVEGPYRGKKEVWENRINIADGLDKCFTTDLFTAAAKRYITGHLEKNESPFFLYLAYDVPHAVLEYATQAYPEGGGVEGGLQWTGQPGRMINTASGEIDSYVHPDYRDLTYDHDGDPATPEVAWPDTYKRYASSCRRIDDGIGDIMSLLKDLGIDENTLVVFTSDNGPSRESYLPEGNVPNDPTFFNSFGPFDGIKRDTWEGGVRVPTIVNWPTKIPANTLIESPSIMYDWLPTFAEAAGIPVPGRVDGTSLIPELTGEGTPKDHLVYIEYSNNQPTPNYEEFHETHRLRARNQMQKIRIGDLVGVRYDIQSADDDFEIYNVVNDPQEIKNMAGSEPYSEFQKMLKEKVLQVRRPNESARRPYDSALISGVVVKGPKQGLKWKSWEGTFPWVADLSNRTPSKEGNIEQPALLAFEQPGIIQFEGFLQVPEDGNYRLSAVSASSFLMRIHEALLLDGSYGYQPDTEISGSIFLKAGFHPIRIWIHKRETINTMFELQWTGPGIEKEVIPVRHFHLPG